MDAEQLLGDVLVVALDDLRGGLLSDATAAALTAHAPLRSVALPDGSVAPTLPLRVLRSDDARVRAATAAWNTPFGWLRAPVARLLLVGGVSASELSGRVLAAARAASEAADACRTPWVLLHVVRAPERDDEVHLTDALRGWFPNERVARLVLAPDGAAPAAGAATLDARLGECIRTALAWRSDAFRAELARLQADAAPPGPGESAAQLQAEYAAGVAEGLAALLESAAWFAPALAACDALAARLSSRRRGPFVGLRCGGRARGDETPRILVDARQGAPDAAPTGRLTRFELRQRVFARAARLLRAAGQHDELGRRGVVLVRTATAEIVASGATRATAEAGAAASSDAEPRMPHVWASAACLQLAALLQVAQADALALVKSSSSDVLGVLATRAQVLSRTLGELLVLALGHLRHLADVCRPSAGWLAAPSSGASELDLADVSSPFTEDDAMPMVLHALTGERAFDVACVRLSLAASGALLNGGRPRAAGAMSATASRLLLELGARARGTSLLLSRCRALAAEGWHALLANALAPLACADSEAEEPADRAEAALMLLSLPPGCSDVAARRAALSMLASLTSVSHALEGGCLLAVSLPRGSQPQQLLRAGADHNAFVDVELWSRAPDALELQHLVLHLVRLDADSDAAPIACAGPAALRIAPGRALVQFVVAASEAPCGTYGLGTLVLRLGQNTLVVQPGKRFDACTSECGVSCWPGGAVSALGAAFAAPSAGGCGSQPRAALILTAAATPLAVHALLRDSALTLGSSAQQWIGVCVCVGGEALLAAELALSGGPGLDVMREQVALLRAQHGADAWVWERARMTDGVLALPPTAPGRSVVAWVRVRAPGHAPLRAFEADDAGTPALLTAHAPLRLNVMLRHRAHGSPAQLLAAALPVPVAAAIGVACTAKYLPGGTGLDGCMVLQTRLASQLPVSLEVHEVLLQPVPGGGASCGRDGCCCRQTHVAAARLSFPAPLPPRGEGELAALFMPLRPCARASAASLRVTFALPGARSNASAELIGASDLADAPHVLDECARTLPPEDTSELQQHECCFAVRLADVPSVRVIARVPQLGRVGESMCISWVVRRLAQDTPCHDSSSWPAGGGAGAVACSRSDEPRTQLPHVHARSDTPTYEADDERDDAQLPPSSRPTAFALRWELRAPASRWLVLSAREGALLLDDAAATEAVVTADCVPVAFGELSAPTLSLRWQTSGTSVRGVWEEPPTAALLRVLPPCS